MIFGVVGQVKPFWALYSKVENQGFQLRFSQEDQSNDMIRLLSEIPFGILRFWWFKPCKVPSKSSDVISFAMLVNIISWILWFMTGISNSYSWGLHRIGWIFPDWIRANMGIFYMTAAVLGGGDQLALVLHTSGTTKKPKIVPLTPRDPQRRMAGCGGFTCEEPMKYLDLTWFTMEKLRMHFWFDHDT